MLLAKHNYVALKIKLLSITVLMMLRFLFQFSGVQPVGRLDFSNKSNTANSILGVPLLMLSIFVCTKQLFHKSYHCMLA